MISFSGDGDGKNVREEPETFGNEGEANATFNHPDEERNVGSTISFKDYGGRESVEILGYEKDEREAFHSE